MERVGRTQCDGLETLLSSYLYDICFLNVYVPLGRCLKHGPETKLAF
jgi:hypothetical protein